MEKVNCVKHDMDRDSCSSSDSESSRSGRRSDSESSENENDYIEPEEPAESAKAVCLFCSDNLTADKSIFFEHLKEAHLLDMSTVKIKYKMDQLSYIQMINYFRTKTGCPELLIEYQKPNFNARSHDLQNKKFILEILEWKGSVPPWSEEEYMQPVLEDDPLLRIYFEDDENDQLNVASKCVESMEVVPSTSFDLDCTSLSLGAAGFSGDAKCEEAFNNLMEKNQLLEQRIHAHESTITEYTAQINNMKGFIQRYFADTEDERARSRNRKSRFKDSAEEAEDDYYFESYDEVGIHATMLKDAPRTKAYMKAIQNNAVDFKGKAVLDLGCGTGILSMFAAKAGARRVFAVDRSKIIFEAMDIIHENKLDHIIECVRGSIEDLDLPEKVDIIVSEFMGYFLLYEGMLNSLIVARDRFLKPGGKMLPDFADMIVIGISDEKNYQEEIGLWEDVYGFKMTAMKRRALQEPIIETALGSTVCTNSAVVHTLNLNTCSESDTIIDTEFLLTCKLDLNLTAIAGYFDVRFNAGSSFKRSLTTSPLWEPTHWKQAIFPLPKMIPAKMDQVLACRFQCRPSDNNPRWLAVTFTVDNVYAKYELR